MSVLFDEQVMDHAQAHLEVVFVGLVLKHLNVKQPLKLRKLKLMDMYGDMNDEFVEELLGTCHSLEKLAMIYIDLRSAGNAVESICIQNGQTLQALDISTCYKYDFATIKLIADNCVELRSLHLGRISNDSFHYLVNNLTPKISKLSLKSSVAVENITTLVSRCKKLTMLSLQGSLLTNNSVTSIIDHLKPTLEVLDLCENDNISLAKLLELKSMPNLKALNFSLSENDMKYLKEQIPHVKIGTDYTVIDSNGDFFWDD